MELASSAAKDGANIEVLDAVLRYEDGVGGAQHEAHVFVGAKSTGAARHGAAHRCPDYFFCG